MSRFMSVFFLFVFLFFGYGIYTNINKKSAKAHREPCQQKTITFEKIHSNAHIKKAKQRLHSGNYVIASHMEYSTQMTSNLTHHLNVKQANEHLISLLPLQQKPNNDALNIHYYIYENDKKDQGKKNKNALKYAGYLVFEFKLNNQLIYKIQTDYMELNGSDIQERMSCVIQSFLSIKEK